MPTAAALTAKVELGAAQEALVPATILGHNLEATEKTVLGMLSNRLENPKFVGPHDPNGFAPPWRSSLDFFQAARAEIDPGVSLSLAGSSQMFLSYSGVEGMFSQALLQTKRPVRSGETLEAVLWAKARHKPVTVRMGVRPEAMTAAPYAFGDVVVDAPHWKRYRVELEIPQDDDAAVFTLALVGDGLIWIDQLQLRRAGEPHVDPAVLERIERLRVPVLRFPGGCLASNYRWRHGTGPVERRPALLDTPNRRTLNYDFGTDEYLELCHAQGIRPHITVNIGTGTPEEAAEWAAYVADWFRAREVEPPVAYFQVGNEDNGIHEHSHMTGAMYAEVLRAYVPAIRAAYPAARIIAVGEKHGQTLTEAQAPWREAVLPVARELKIDVLVLHIYRLGRARDPFERHAEAVAAAADGRAALAELLADCRAAGVESAIGVTEWNFWTTASHWDGTKAYERSGATMEEPYGASHAFFAAGLIHGFAALAPDFELANFYHLINGMGVLSHRGIDVEDRPMAALFEFYRPALPGRRVAVEVSGGDADAPLEALALDGDDGRWLLLANPSAREAVTVTLDGAGLPGSAPEEVVALAAPDPAAPLTSADAPALDGDGTLTLPPLAIVRLRWAA